MTTLLIILAPVFTTAAALLITKEILRVERKRQEMIAAHIFWKSRFEEASAEWERCMARLDLHGAKSARERCNLAITRMQMNATGRL